MARVATEVAEGQEDRAIQLGVAVRMVVQEDLDLVATVVKWVTLSFCKKMELLNKDLSDD